MSLADLQLERENAAEVNVVSAPSGEEWYYREAQKFKNENPDWNSVQITAKMSETVWNNNYNALIDDIAKSRSPEKRDQKIEDYRSQLLAFDASGINVDNDVAYLRNMQSVEHQYELSPMNPGFVDATLSFQDMANGYHLEYNENGILWRVKASGEPHPDDLATYYQQLEYNQSVSDNLSAKVSMDLGDYIAGKATQETSVVAKKIIQTERTLVQGASNSGDSLFNGPLIASAGVSDVDPYFLGSGTENATDGSILDKISDKWRKFEAWQERGKYLRAYERAKHNLETFDRITPDHSQYEDALAAEVERCIIMEEASPLGIGRVGALTKSVYYAITAGGIVRYVGITNDIARRAAEHLSTKGIQIQGLIPNLSVRDARAVEQALIELHGLGYKGGTLLNKINSISPSNPEYAKLVQRGYELLKSIDYGGVL